MACVNKVETKNVTKRFRFEFEPEEPPVIHGGHNRGYPTPMAPTTGPSPMAIESH